MAGFSFWEFINILRQLVVSDELKLLLHNITNAIVIPVVLFFVFFFVLSFIEKERWTKWILAISTVYLVGMSVLLVIYPELLYVSRGLVFQGPVTYYGITFEQWAVHDRALKWPFFIHQIFIYISLLTGTGMLLWHLWNSQNRHNTNQVAVIAMGFLAPLIANSLIFLEIVAPHQNFTDLAFGVTAVCFGIAIFRYNLFQSTPIGRQQLFNLMDDPLVFLDNGNHVVDSNPTARRVFGVGAGWKGMDAVEFFGPHFEQIRPFLFTDEPNEYVTVESDSEKEFFDVNITTVPTIDGDVGGRIVALRNITTLERTKRELERSNERLDEFASIVAHDLRTPLNIASYKMKYISREQSDEHTDALEEALSRMESMVDDMLRLARAGDEIETDEQCNLAELAKEVWGIMETKDSELEIELSHESVEADPARLFQVFENLFRNAIKHNDSPVTIRVGRLHQNVEPNDSDVTSGVFIEDNGNGIQTDELNTIFEHGHTTSDGGTGYGLTVVRTIVETHGWTIRVTEESNRGARFEIIGMDFE